MEIREQLFNIMRQFGFQMKMFDNDGNGPLLEELEADYFYCVKGDINIMIVVADQQTSDYNTVRLYRNNTIDKYFFRKILQKVKNIVVSNAYTLKIENFGRQFTPKDFAYMPKLKTRGEDELAESFDVSGKKKTQYFKKDNAKVVVKHNDYIDETKRYANSRKIKEVFVVTGDGEKRKMPNANLTLGKAVANHVNHGGNLYDDETNKLILLSQDIQCLRGNMLSEKLREDVAEDKIVSLKKFIQEKKDLYNKLVRNLQARKSKIPEGTFPDYNTPEHTFSKSFFSEFVDEELANKFARISICLKL